MSSNALQKRLEKAGAAGQTMTASQALTVMNTKPRPVDLDQIEIDQSLQFRAGLNEAYVDELKTILENGGELPAIEVFDTGEGPYLLVAGFHRVAAYMRLGEKSIHAIIYRGSREEAAIASARSNFGHGLQYSRDDKPKVFNALMDMGYWTNETSLRIIAKEMGVGHATIGRWKNERLTVSNETVEASEFSIGADGRRIRVSNIQRASRERATEYDTHPDDGRAKPTGNYDPSQPVPTIGRHQLTGVAKVINGHQLTEANGEYEATGQPISIDAAAEMTEAILDGMEVLWNAIATFLEIPDRNFRLQAPAPAEVLRGHVAEIRALNLDVELARRLSLLDR